jgi:hypothetical protein
VKSSSNPSVDKQNIFTDYGKYKESKQIETEENTPQKSKVQIVDE